MDLQFALTKIKNLTGLESIDQRYIEDVEKLVDEHNAGNISLHTRMKLLAEQISLGLNDPYKRIMELKKYGKDSSSLAAFILRYGDVEGPKRRQEKNNKTAHTLESYIKKYGEVDGPIKFAEYCKTKSMSLEMCIKRYGEVEGPKRYREYWDTTGFGTNPRAFKKRYGDDWEIYFNEFKKSQGEANTLDGKIARYGVEEGTRLYKEVNQKKSKSSNKETVVQKLLDQGLSFQEIQQYIKDRWDNVSLNSFCSRYGDELGKQKYQEHIKRCRESNVICIEYYEKRGIPKEIAFEIISKIQWERCGKVNTTSKESLKYLDKFNEIFCDRGYTCQYKENEFGILLTQEEYDVYRQNMMYFYDFYVPDLKLIIEYHGALYHDNIDYSSTIGVSVDAVRNMTYNKDFHKKWLAEQRGYTVYVLRSWEIEKDILNVANALGFSEEEKCKFV